MRLAKYESDAEREFWTKREAESRTNYQAVLEQLCRMQSIVARTVFSDATWSNDCFCKRGGFWTATHNPVEEGTFDNRRRVLDFIERAVERAIEQHAFDVAHSEPAIADE